jgi:hypothetical protein
MSGKKDKPDDIEQLLNGLSAEDLARVRALLDRSSPGSPMLVNIGGPAIGCAIGANTAVSARDIVTALGGQVADERQRAADRLVRALSQRRLADPDAADFGQTVYAKRMQLTDALRRPVAMRTVGFFLAQMPAPLVRESDRDRFMAWMDGNKRIYPPIRVPYFIPGMVPQRISKAVVWHNGNLPRFPQGNQHYFTYLAAEIDDGFIEYGFSAGAVIEPYTNGVSFSRAVAGFMCFLQFIRDLAETFGGDAAAVSVGLALRGTNGTALKEFTDPNIEAMCSTPPVEKPGFLWTQPADGADWSPDVVARAASVELLDHWSILPPPGAEEPEFSGGKYSGRYYKYYCNGQWA